MIRAPLLRLLLLSACTPEEKQQTVALGVIAAERDGEQAAVSAARAFAYDADTQDGGQAVVWFGGDPDATCEAVAARLAGSRDDPAGILLAGTCEFAVRMDYEGSAVTHTSDPLAGIPAIGCAMDEDPDEPGAWSEVDGAWIYSGHWWQGSPDLDGAWSMGLAPAEGGGYTLTLDMHAFDGDFIYEALEDAPANGSITGAVPAEYCEGLQNATIFR